MSDRTNPVRISSLLLYSLDIYSPPYSHTALEKNQSTVPFPHTN